MCFCTHNRYYLNLYTKKIEILKFMYEICPNYDIINIKQYKNANTFMDNQLHTLTIEKYPHNDTMDLRTWFQQSFLKSSKKNELKKYVDEYSEYLNQLVYKFEECIIMCSCIV